LNDLRIGVRSTDDGFSSGHRIHVAVKAQSKSRVVDLTGCRPGHDDDVDRGQIDLPMPEGIPDQAFEPVPVDGTADLLS
jgi:hypothetical protein